MNCLFSSKFTSLAAALLTIAAGAFTLAGCQTNTSPSPGMGDPYPAPMNDPQISVLSPELRQWLGFQTAIVVNDGEHPMSVEVPVRNLTDNQYLIEYRCMFYDAHGRELQPVMGWKFVSLDPKQVQRLRANALTDEARNYRLEVRWSR